MSKNIINVREGDIVVFHTRDPDLYVPAYKILEIGSHKGTFIYTHYNYMEDLGMFTHSSKCNYGDCNTKAAKLLTCVAIEEDMRWGSLLWKEMKVLPLITYSYALEDLFPEDELEFDLNEDTKEFCPRCFSENVHYVNFAMKCNHCWHTW